MHCLLDDFCNTVLVLIRCFLVSHTCTHTFITASYTFLLAFWIAVHWILSISNLSWCIFGLVTVTIICFIYTPLFPIPSPLPPSWSRMQPYLLDPHFVLSSSKVFHSSRSFISWPFIDITLHLQHTPYTHFPSHSSTSEPSPALSLPHISLLIIPSLLHHFDPSR